MEEERKENMPIVPSPPLVTVVVPCYNHGKYLEQAVQSLFSQTYQNLDIAIVNDGSTDDTAMIANYLIFQDHKGKEYLDGKSRVRVIHLEKNHGRWFALNEAIRTSEASLVTCQDADDLSLPNRIERQVNTLVATQSVHVLTGFHNCWSEQDVVKYLAEEPVSGDLKGIDSETTLKMVEFGFNTEGINSFYTADFETAGASALFWRQLWKNGFRFNPPETGLRVASSEYSDFNIRMTLALRNTVVLAEKLYLKRHMTDTNNEK